MNSHNTPALSHLDWHLFWCSAHFCSHSNYNVNAQKIEYPGRITGKKYHCSWQKAQRNANKISFAIVSGFFFFFFGKATLKIGRCFSKMVKAANGGEKKEKTGVLETLFGTLNATKIYGHRAETRGVQEIQCPVSGPLIAFGFSWQNQTKR